MTTIWTVDAELIVYRIDIAFSRMIWPGITYVLEDWGSELVYDVHWTCSGQYVGLAWNIGTCVATLSNN